jgi:hypothetical protein
LKRLFDALRDQLTASIMKISRSSAKTALLAFHKRPNVVVTGGEGLMSGKHPHITLFDLG